MTSGLPVPGVAGQLTRRRLLRGAAAGAGLGAVALGTGLSACSAPGPAPVPVPPAAADQSRTRKVVRFVNWYDYIDVTPSGVSPTLMEFTRQTGIKVDYTPLFADANQALGLVGIALAAGKDPGYDLVVVADWMLAQFIEQGWVAELSPGLLTNARRLRPQFRDWPVPDLPRYALPWQGGFTGIGYNAKVTRRPVTGMTDLLTAPDLRGRVSLVSDMRDVVGLVLLDQGSNPADFTAAEFGRALAMLRRSVAVGQIRMVTNNYLPALAKGTVAAGVAWSGDILYARQLSPALGFTWPEGGGMVWTDNMMVPALAPVRANAERLMNFYYQPAVAAQLAAFNRFLCPVLGTQAVMGRLDPALARERYIFPAPALLDSGHYFKILSRAQIAAYTAAFQTAVGL
ncbi:MAG TPA: spermidine/putrescine ABC transporter substrate-binding protein [Streptosporangiaceae bacterium]|nr:spermidine/putrescine ABC transporter substrate-binding protein [Streptosporangiaceae bacterium]